MHRRASAPHEPLTSLAPLTETLRFKEEGVFAVVKDVFLPWYNAYRFLVQVRDRVGELILNYRIVVAQKVCMLR